MSRSGIAGVLLLLVAVAAAGYWAGSVALRPPSDPLGDTTDPVTYEVVEQTLGEALQFAAVAEWEQAPLARAGSSGLVTSIGFANGDTVGSGDVLFTTDLRPVAIVAGSIPSFRDLGPGIAGPDVRQLESFLTELGYLEVEADETFDETTADALRAWQESIGAPPTGAVARGDLIFVAELPVRIAATDALAVGAPLIQGEIILNRVSAAPSIVVPLAPEQRNLVPLSGAVLISYPEGTWEAVITRAAEAFQDGAQRLDLVLEAPSGGPACGDECADWVPIGERTSFAADIIIVPELTGPVVPVAAITTEPDGDHMLELANGDRVPVEVLVSTGGLAVVDGVQPGDVVVLPFAAPSP